MQHLRKYETFTNELPVTFDFIRESEGFEATISLNGEVIGTVGAEAQQLTSSITSYTIIDAEINEEFRGKGLYKKLLLYVLKEIGVLATLHSVFRSESAEYAWRSLLKSLPERMAYAEYLHVEENTAELVVYRTSMTFFLKDQYFMQTKKKR